MNCFLRFLERFKKALITLKRLYYRKHFRKLRAIKQTFVLETFLFIFEINCFLRFLEVKERFQKALRTLKRLYYNFVPPLSFLNCINFSVIVRKCVGHIQTATEKKKRKKKDRKKKKKQFFFLSFIRHNKMSIIIIAHTFIIKLKSVKKSYILFYFQLKYIKTIYFSF